MSNQNEKAASFRALHVPGQPLVLFNIWDPGSAKAVTEAGAKAIATGSWSVANANNFADGERIPLDLAIANLARIVNSIDLPVTVDLESGYGADPEAVGHAVTRTIEAGAIGCNLEDSFPESGKLRGIVDQIARIEHARKAAVAAGIPYFINARTDVFFQKPAAAHDISMLAEALERASAYSNAGADCLFVPGLIDRALIARLVEASPLPINVMVGDNTPSRTALAQMGVVRVSHGPGPYLAMMNMLEQAAHAALRMEK